MKSKIITIVFALLLFFSSAFCLLKPETEFSDAERRPLAVLPSISAESIFGGNFMKKFEEYSTDQFPLRDKFRTIKAMFSRNILRKAEDNGIFFTEGHVSKLDENLNEDTLSYSAGRLKSIYERYLKEGSGNLYLSIIPDKNFFIAEKNGYPAFDFLELTGFMTENLPFLSYIDISGLLSSDDYYFTDTHWRQEEILDVAEFLASSMGVNASSSYTVNTLDHPFNGVYVGQSALPLKPDTLKYLTNDALEKATVLYYGSENGKEGSLYDMNKAFGKDPYEIFLSGSSPIVTIENESASSKKHLVLFRDSFGGSIAPLLSPGYKKITVVDTRYVHPDYLGNFIDFSSADDVLFLYSTTILNSSRALQ